LFADTTAVEQTAAGGMQENSNQMNVTNAFTVLLERRNRQPSIQSELR
jgi:hypothetical protein